jgi:hypothetical protein
MDRYGARTAECVRCRTPRAAQFRYSLQNSPAQKVLDMGLGVVLLALRARARERTRTRTRE